MGLPFQGGAGVGCGATISGASDWFVSSPNVFLAIYQAETRERPERVLNADECMPREAMPYAYTRNSARAMNQLDKIGSIAVGKQADFVVVDRDVLTIPAEELQGSKILWLFWAARPSSNRSLDAFVSIS